jgi:hypothetical protein
MQLSELLLNGHKILKTILLLLLKIQLDELDGLAQLNHLSVAVAEQLGNHVLADDTLELKQPLLIHLQRGLQF